MSSVGRLVVEIGAERGHKYRSATTQQWTSVPVDNIVREIEGCTLWPRCRTGVENRTASIPSTCLPSEYIPRNELIVVDECKNIVGDGAVQPKILQETCALRIVLFRNMRSQDNPYTTE